MGDIVSIAIHNYPDGFAQDVTNTSQKDWITKHAELAELSIVETERLWNRFQQLGCDEAGIIHNSRISTELRYKEDVLMRNLLLALIGGDKVYFHTFLNIMKWTSEATVEQKCKAVYSFFNNGNSLGRELFRKILKRIYPGKDEDTIQRYLDIVFEAMSPSAANTQRELSFDDFMRICNVLPEAQLNEVLQFNIIPSDINEEAQQRFEPQWRSNVDGTKRDLRDAALVCQESIDELSKDLGVTSDWSLVIRDLGFSDSEIKTEGSKYRDDQSKVNAMLTKWRNQQKERATVGVLRTVINKRNPALKGAIYGITVRENN